MSFFRIFALAGRIIRQVLRDKRTLALIFGVPLLVMSLLYVVLTNTSSVHTLALVRPTGKENEAINKQIAASLPGKDKLNVINIKATDVDRTLRDGNADAAIVFPSDFNQQVDRGNKPKVQIILEGSDPNVATQMDAISRQSIAQLGIGLATQKVIQSTVAQLIANEQRNHPPQLGQGQPTATPLSTSAPTVTPEELQKFIPFSVPASHYIYGGSQYTFNDAIAPVFIGIFSFFFVFLLTSVSFLRERMQGTIERIMVSPLKRTELVMGYICGFTLFALVQSLVILLFVIFALRVHYSGNLALVFLISALLTVGSVNLGIFLSTFAQNELQIIQFIPLVLGVQIFLSGVFWPVAQLPTWLRPVAYILPLTYANDALRGVMLKGYDFAQIINQFSALLVFALLMIVLSSLTMRRQIA